ncbi:MAG: 6,7-dimethyl-8-ribityllumazine synthase [Rhodobacteraceae bacterium]|nr:6,7-dimethyl-8-ribityllumazine synthase [Paracoccaceae bacterium]
MTLTPKIAFIKARWHADIVDQAHAGFMENAEGWQVDAYDVPGAFEAPLLAKRLAKQGYDAVVIAALVVDGGIYRHDFVAAAVVNGIMQVQLETDVPMFSVSLTPHQFHSNAEHLEFYSAHFVKKGAEAADAVRMVLNQFASLSIAAE